MIFDSVSNFVSPSDDGLEHGDGGSQRKVLCLREMAWEKVS